MSTMPLPSRASTGHEEFDTELTGAIANTYLSFPISDPASVFFRVSDDELRPLSLLPLAYLSGEFDKITKIYLDTPSDSTTRFIASATALPAAIAMGDWEFYRRVEYDVHKVTGLYDSAVVRAFAEHALATGYLGARALRSVPRWIKVGDFGDLPPLARFEAYVQRADYLGLARQYELMLSTAQMALYLLGTISAADETSITGINLRLRVAIAYYHLNRYEDARTWLLDTMNLALPNGFITPFAENAVKVSGLVEELLKEHYTDWLEPVVDLACEVVPN